MQNTEFSDILDNAGKVTRRRRRRRTQAIAKHFVFHANAIILFKQQQEKNRTKLRKTEKTWKKK